MTDIQQLKAEIAELRLLVDSLQRRISGSYGAAISVLGIVCHALETRNVVARSEIAEALVRKIATADAERRQKQFSNAELEAQMIGRALLKAFVDQLLTAPPPPPPKPGKTSLRVVADNPKRPRRRQ